MIFISFSTPFPTANKFRKYVFTANYKYICSGILSPLISPAGGCVGIIYLPLWSRTYNYFVLISSSWYFVVFTGSVVLNRNTVWYDVFKEYHVRLWCTLSISTGTWQCDLPTHVKQPRLQSCVKTATSPATRAVRGWHDGAGVRLLGADME